MIASDAKEIVDDAPSELVLEEEEDKEATTTTFESLGMNYFSPNTKQ